ncbi:MAG: hypothetical protein SGILL_005147 [Bacillariaceae sp.]
MAVVQSDEKKESSSWKSGNLAAMGVLLISMALLFGAIFGSHADAVVGYQRELVGASDLNSGLRSRRLQAVPTPAPVAANETNSTGFPSYRTDTNFTLCGTCQLPVLGPFVGALSDALSTEGWDARVTVLGRSPCTACGGGSGARTQETFSFQIVQSPNVNATIGGNSTNAVESIGVVDLPDVVLSTDLIDVEAALADIEFVNALIEEVAEETAEITGTEPPLVFQGVEVADPVEVPADPVTGGDDQLQVGIPTDAPSTEANVVGNRFLNGHRYLTDLGRHVEQDPEEVSLSEERLFDVDGNDTIGFENSDDPFECKCVACEEDPHCGGLWTGSVVAKPQKENRTKIHIVVSHCKSSLHWLSKFTAGHVVDSITVISKCGAEVKGAPEDTDVLVLPNLGRCDHSYAYYMAYMLEEKVPEEDRENSVVFFLKDDISVENLHQDGSWNTFSDMLQIGASERGFACGIRPSYVDAGPNRFFVSAYHEYNTLKEFSMHSYSRNIKGYSVDTSTFLSGFDNIDDWARSLPGNPEPQEIVQVCYGGVFAASVSNVFNQDIELWRSITQSLSRGNNIQEGHFAERSWARLLSTPLEDVQIRALTDTADGVYLNEAAMHGPLTRTPKIYIHAGAPETSVGSVENDLARDVTSLKADGYQLAVHGRPELGIDVDRLAACMWNGFEGLTFSATQMSSAYCPPKLLSDLEDYLETAMADRQDIIISNPWLVRDSTADSLGHFLDYKWEVHPVVYYRRYYDWISTVFQSWRKGNHFEPNAIPMSTIRQIDFIREYCKRLFYGSMIPDDAPFRDFTSRKLSHEKMRVHHAASFHPNLPIQELTDLKEYTYFIAKQYEEVPRFADNVHIVNYHADDKVSDLYCNVLSHGINSCKDARRLEANTTQMVTDVVKNVLDKDQSFVELALGAYMKGKLQAPDAGSSGFHSQVQHWANMIQSRLENSKFSFDDLPVECLEDFEMQRLLQVSLAYERDLLPEFFASSNGESILRSDFARRTFCSIDAAEALHHPVWAFLFEQDDQETLLKAYVHVGGPNTNSATVQESLIQDQALLAQDNFSMAVHGAARASPDDSFVADNMLLDTDLIGACLWDQEERDHVALSNPEAAVCQPGMMPRFRKFVNSAAAERKKLLISNEWLSHMSSEAALDQVLDADTWDVNIVLYYRRYFEWLYTMYGSWREAITAETMEDLEGKVQFTDFTRLINKRLFASGDIGEHDRHSTSTDSYVDLVDVQEYTYSLWRQFTSVDRFQTSVHILDYHQQEEGDAAQDLYCRVLDGADNACKDKTTEKSVPLTPAAVNAHRNLKAQEEKSSGIENLVIGAYYSGAVSAMNNADQKDDEWMPMDETTLDYWHVVLQSNMEVLSMCVDDLPQDCLEEYELDLLQDVSLSFEKLLMPEKFKQGGAKELVNEFSAYKRQNRFCSLDIASVMSNEDLVASLFSLEGHQSPPTREFVRDSSNKKNASTDKAAADFGMESDDMVDFA